MILFVGSQGRLRSRTAEMLCLFGGVHARCAGLDVDAESPLSDAQIRKATTIICMEAEHYDALSKFPSYHQREGLKAFVLHIPDVFDRLAPELIAKLIRTVRQSVPHGAALADVMQKGATQLEALEGYGVSLGTLTRRVS